jgi:ribonuclease BN (tRNA processing enzyme)
VRTLRLQAGLPGPTPSGERPAADGVLLDEPGVRVRAVTLDHGTPVLGFAFEPPVQLNVRKDRLEARGLAPGAWLNALKQRMLAGDGEAAIRLPNGRAESVESLAADLVRATPGAKLAYATDFGDTLANRQRVERLAAGAHTLFCESTFLVEDEDQARRTGHLTTRACGAIGQAAGAQHLVPFHFSRRYQHSPWRLYDEIAAVCPRVVRPTVGG